MRAAVLALLVAACSPPAPEMPDGGPAPADASSPDAAPQVVSLTEGVTYGLSWRCESGCVGQLPAANYTRLTYEAGSLSFWWATCESCAVTDIALIGESGCIGGAGIPQGSAGPTDGYEFCPGLGAATARVAFTGYPGDPMVKKVWTASAVPL